MRLINNLKHILHFHKHSQDDFGEMFGLKRGAIGNILRGVTKPSLELVTQIAIDFEITLDQLVLGDLEEIKPWTINMNDPKNIMGLRGITDSGLSTDFKNSLLKALKNDNDVRDTVVGIVEKYKINEINEQFLVKAAKLILKSEEDKSIQE